MAKGIEERHGRSCRTRKGGRCDCEPSYRASVWDGATRTRHRHAAKSRSEAEQWRRDAKLAMRRGRRPQGRSTTTLRDAWTEWKRLAEQKVIRRNRGEEFKPATIRAYDADLRIRVLPRYGNEPLGDIHRTDLQQLVDDLLTDGSAPATIHKTIAAVSAIYRHEISRGRLRENPCNGLDIPTEDNGRKRFAAPQEAAALLTAVPADDRAIWATAMYGGLRCGELRALEAQAIRLDDGVISVESGWDLVEGRIATKGRNKRKVPIPFALREVLAAELLRTGRRERQLVFGSTDSSPFSPQALQRRADKAWEAAKLKRLTPHDCRHSYASLMIAAGVNAKSLSSYMGHSSIQITFDRYGHLMPGNEEEAAGLLDTYLERSAV